MGSETSTSHKYCNFMNYVDEVLTPQLTHKTVSDCGKLCTPIASPSYTVLAGKTDLLLDADTSNYDLVRPVTVALAPNALAGRSTTHASWDHHRPLNHIGQSDLASSVQRYQESHGTGKEPRAAQLCQADKKKKSEMILNDLKEDGFLVGKSGLSFTIHFCDDKLEAPSSVKTLPPLSKASTDSVYRHNLRHQREQIDRKAQDIIDRANQCLHKRDRIVERLMYHRVSSSTERNVELKVDKSIRLEDKKRRKAAVEARREQQESRATPHAKLVQEHSKIVQEHAKLAQEHTSSRCHSRKGQASSSRLKSSKSKKERKGKRS
jgi:hypothetical protein